MENTEYSDNLTSEENSFPQIHDHHCFLYESPEEWASFIGIYIRTGLEQGERCMYIFDTHSARQVRDTLKSQGVDVTAAEASGQLLIMHGRKVYTRDGVLAPVHMIRTLRSEMAKTLEEGYPALRVTTETDWVLNYEGQDEIIFQFTAELNSDFLPKNPCLCVCQYDLKQFKGKLINDVLLTHSGVIRDNKVFSNFYYFPPNELAHSSESGVHSLLTAIEREDRREKERKNRSRAMQVVIEEVMAVIFVVDDNNKFLNANKTTCEFLDCQHKDLIGKSIYDFIAPASSSDGENSHRFLKSTSKHEVKFKVNGQIKTLLVHTIPVFVDGKRLIYCIGQDITERTKIEKAWCEIEDKFYKLYLSMRENVALFRIMTDSDGKAVDYVFTDLNPAFEKIIGLKKEDIIGKKGFEVFRTKTSPYLDVLARVVKSGESTLFEADFPFYHSRFNLFVFALGKDEFAVVFNPIK